MGGEQRGAQCARPCLERIEHQGRLASWRRYRIRLQGALDGTTGIRLSCAGGLELSNGPRDSIEPQRSVDHPGINYKFESGISATGPSTNYSRELATCCSAICRSPS